MESLILAVLLLACSVHPSLFSIHSRRVPRGAMMKARQGKNYQNSFSNLMSKRRKTISVRDIVIPKAASENEEDSELLAKIHAQAKLTMPTLKEELKKRGLRVSGKKAELLDRLRQHLEESISQTSGDDSKSQEATDDFGSNEELLASLEELTDSQAPTLPEDIFASIPLEENSVGDSERLTDIFEDLDFRGGLLEEDRKDALVVEPQAVEKGQVYVPDHLWDNSDEEDDGYLDVKMVEKTDDQGRPVTEMTVELPTIIEGNDDSIENLPLASSDRSRELPALTGQQDVDMRSMEALKKINDMIDDIDRRYEEKGLGAASYMNLVHDGIDPVELKEMDTFHYDGFEPRSDLPLKINTRLEMHNAYRRRYREELKAAGLPYVPVNNPFLESGYEELPEEASYNVKGKFDWKSPKGIPKDYGLTFEELDALEYGEEEKDLTPEQKHLRRERRREFRKLVDWYDDHMQPPRVRIAKEEEKETRKMLDKIETEGRPFSRELGDMFDDDVPVPTLADIKAVKIVGFNTGKVLEDAPAIFMVYDKSKEPVYCGMSLNFNSSLEVIKKRRPTEAVWMRYYVLPKYEHQERLVGMMAPIQLEWFQQLGFVPVGNNNTLERNKWEYDVIQADPGFEALKSSLR